MTNNVNFRDLKNIISASAGGLRMDTNQLTLIATQTYDRQAQNNQITAQLVRQQHAMLEELKKQTAAQATRRELAETGTQVGTAQIVEQVSQGTQSELTGGIKANILRRVEQFPPPSRGRTSRSPRRVQDQPEQEPVRKPIKAELSRPPHTQPHSRFTFGASGASSSGAGQPAQRRGRRGGGRGASSSSPDPDL